MANKKPKLSLTTILNMACSNPEDFKAWDEWNTKQQILRSEATEENPYKWQDYPGWNRYDITLHCQKITVIAKPNPNGGYHIKDYIVQDH